MIKIEILMFEGSSIRLRATEHGSVEWLCLNDILKHLNRTDMIESGRMLKICRSIARHPFKDGGRNRWAIRPYDVHHLLRVVSTENGAISAKCQRLHEWVNSLPMQMELDSKPISVESSNEMMIFNYQDRFPITFKTDCGRTFVNATQMAKSFNKYPFVWLSLAATNEFREALVGRGESPSLESQIITIRGKNGVTWIEESLAMEFARWLSPDFSAWCNIKIKEVVDNGYTTMQPNHGADRVAQPPATTNFAIPKTFDEALLLAAEQAKRLRESEHKVSFYDEYVEHREVFKSSRIADELEVSIVILNRFLAQEGIVHYESNRKRWVVNAPFRPLQCDAPYLWQKEDGKVYPFGTVKRWTQAGREYIIELWNEKNRI